MEEENAKLKERMATVQTKATSALSEKDKLKSDLQAASSTTSRDSALSMESSASTEELTTLQAKIEDLQIQLSSVRDLPSTWLKSELDDIALFLFSYSLNLRLMAH